jgi:hypothetical protein
VPDIFYGMTDYNRERGNFPATPVINMVVEAVPVENKPALQSRLGLKNSAITMGAGPVKALFHNDGVLAGNTYGISNTSLYKEGTLVGAIDGTGPARIDGYESFLFATAGTRLWGYNGVTLASVTTPDNFEVLSLCVGASRLVVIEKNSGRFWWTGALTASIDAISFATAENSPDRLKECMYVGDVLILFGSKTVEFWPVTQDGDSPFSPLAGRTFSVGIKDTGCATQISSTFAWITNYNQVCIADPENIVSYPDLEAKIEAASTYRLWTFRLEGIEYLAVRLDNETHVFNSRSKNWSEFKSDGATNWLPQCYADGYMGSMSSGTLIQWDTVYSDFGGVLERLFRGGLAIESEGQKLDNITIRTNPGKTPFLSGPYADPTIELRTSNDGGNTWTMPKARSLGVAGDFRPRVQWRSLGMFGPPGMLFELRVVDPVPFRVSNVVANEPYGSV